MARPFFFGGNQTSSTSSASPYLVQFKAGKLTQSGSTVTPIKEKKGLLYLHQTPDDMLMHFCWKDRTSGTVEDDLIIFPDECEFLKVPQCTTGRVFVLKFKTSSRRFFFWSQESKADKDDEWVAKINEYLNNPPTTTSRGGNGGGGGTPSVADLAADESIRSLLSGSDANAQQLMNLLGNVRGLGGSSGLASLLGSVSGGLNARSSTNGGGGGGGGATSTATPNPTPAGASSSNSETSSISGSASTASPGAGGNSSHGVLLQDLQDIIQNIQQQQQPAGSPPPGTAPVRAETDISVDLATSLTLDGLRPLFEDSDFMARVAEHLPPPGEQLPLPPVAAQLATTVQSPQFQQALTQFSAAFQSGQLGPLIHQFGMSDECVAAATAGNLESFLKALNKEGTFSSSSSETGEKGSKKKDDDHEDMALD